MCVSLPLGDLNFDPCPPHPTSIYTYKITTIPKICDCTVMLGVGWQYNNETIHIKCLKISKYKEIFYLPIKLNKIKKIFYFLLIGIF